ncbi:33600_t:CDS:2 [Gigaspora margarita]|uniref:33600_t:CDS:1 n=1 Tax=Gigaspora margarita TaxID=4874 RepID=A0ABN7UHK8_GIGMA|nr:33600_t:CDS:2 [Gigaspora margarita]
MSTPQSSALKFGACPKCSSPRFYYNWCRQCEFYAYQTLYPKWTCQNQDIDLVIKSIQANAGSIFSFIEYIPYEKFQKIKYIGKGGFSTVSEAEWIDGPRDGPPTFEHKDGAQDPQMPKWERSGPKKLRVLSRHIPPNNTYSIPGLLRCYGITRDPKTQEFMMVFQHCSQYDLQTYLSRLPYTTLPQSQKLISQIVNGLKEIHKSGLIHKNLHSGNILIDENGDAYIGDTGLCKPVDPAKIRRASEPIKLTFRRRTNSSPIESKPMNLSQRPFIERPHDNELQKEIVNNNLRPIMIEDMPIEYKELISSCFDSDPLNRPSIEYIEKVLNEMICENGINGEGGDLNERETKLGLEIGIKGNGGIRKVLYQERQRVTPHRKAKYISRLIQILNNKTDVNEIKSSHSRNGSQSNLVTSHDSRTAVEAKRTPNDHHVNSPRTSRSSYVLENTQGSVVILNSAGNRQRESNIQKLQSYHRISNMNKCLIPKDEDFRILIDWVYWAN